MQNEYGEEVERYSLLDTGFGLKIVDNECRFPWLTQGITRFAPPPDKAKDWDKEWAAIKKKANKELKRMNDADNAMSKLLKRDPLLEVSFNN